MDGEKYARRRNRIELVMVGRREPVTAKLQEVLSKVPSLKEAMGTLRFATTDGWTRVA